MKTCVKCVLPESYPNITFNENGVCNFCSDHKQPTVLGENELKRIVTKLRNPKCSYDAIIGLSGGRDSSYAAYYAVKELGLKIIGFTYDNGFMPKVTWDNIFNIVSILEIDHKIVTTNDLRNSVRRVLNGLAKKPSPAMVSFLCSGCQTGIKVELAKFAKSINCPIVITGSGEPEKSFARPLLTGSTDDSKFGLARGFLREVIKNPYYLNPNILKSFSREYFHRFFSQKKIHTELDLFRFIPWDEQEILKTITEKLEWRTPDRMSSSWRSDCNINVIRQYLYKELLGFTKNDELLSQLIRNGVITREKALLRLQQENVIDTEFLSEIFSEIDYPSERIYQAMRDFDNKTH